MGVLEELKKLLPGGEKEVKSKEEFREERLYEYSTPEGRVNTAEWLLSQAKSERTGQEELWKRYEDYYNGRHDAAAEMAEQLNEQGVPWTPAAIPDPYIMVESQIIPETPEPEFRGRDDDRDSEKAKQRAMAVKYIIEANRLDDMNTSNERRLRKYGDAFWKAYWDEDMPCGDRKGNIRIKDIPVEDIYVDPTAGPDGLQAGEYVGYLYSTHKLRFWRTYSAALREKDIQLEDITGQHYELEEGMLAPFTSGTEAAEDLVQVLEFWYRQPEDGDGAKAGDIACSIQAGGQEIRYIPNYWQETGRQCHLFPFVHYWCVRDETQFYNRSELAPILELVDAADRELAIGILNDAFTANDIILVEDGALKPGEELKNAPGSVVTVNQGRGGGVARLGGLGSGVKTLNMVEWMLGQIQRANRNYDANNGRETTKVTTASGLLQMRTDAQTQQKLKRADRDAGFCRLYELLDWLALEFFRDDRLLFVGAKKEGDEPEMMRYNGAAFAREIPAQVDLLSGETIAEEEAYYPRVDVTVSCGDPIGKSPAMTLEVLDKLAASQVTEDNWQLLAAELELLDIPQKQEITERWKNKFQPVIPPDVTAALESDPEFLEMVTSTVRAADQVNAQNRQLAAMGQTAPVQSGGGIGIDALTQQPTI